MYCCFICVVGYGGWGTGFTSGAPSLQQQQQLQDEAQFNSLFPVAGFVTGNERVLCTKLISSIFPSLNHLVPKVLLISKTLGPNTWSQ